MAWLTDVLERMVSGRTKATELDRLLPWNWKAEQLAAELNAAAAEARVKFALDFPALAPVIAHTFDVIPICRDCSEGKHGACIGSTFVEVADDIAPDEVECGCSKVDHKLIGGAL